MISLTTPEKRRGVRAKGQHSSASEDWGTGVPIVVRERLVLGRIGIDPASSPKWNQIIGAERIITKRENGRVTPWVPGAPKPHQLEVDVRRAPSAEVADTAHVNPPGDPKGENVAAFWIAAAGYYDLGWLSAVIWVGFSVEQLSRLQRIDAPSHPLQHVTCIPDGRQRYQLAPGVTGDQPGHASFITLLPNSREQVRRFVEVFSDLGHVIVGDRWRR